MLQSGLSQLLTVIQSRLLNLVVAALTIPDHQAEQFIHHHLMDQVVIHTV